MSDFGGLSIGLSGLLAHRRALDVAGHNLANVNTPGYSRQRVDLSPKTAPVGAQVFSTSDASNGGVKASTPYRISDQFLTLRALQEHATDASLTQSQAVLSQLELAVNEPSDTGLSAQINQFMAAWHDVANRPDDVAARQALVETGKTLTGSFAQLDAAMSSIATTSGSQINTTLTDINTIASSVADLNKRILASVSADLPAGDLMDQRDNLVNELAQKAGATVSNRDYGVVDVYIGSTALVRGSSSEQLRADTISTPGQTTIVWDRLGITATPGGQVGALQSMVNTTIPAYRNMLKATENQLMNDVNAIHTTGFDLNGANGIQFFQMNASGLIVNPAIANDPSRIAAASSATALRDGSIAGKIGALTGPGDTYHAMVLHLGVETATVNRQVATQSAVTDQVDAARAATSGVNIDEEMTNMVAIQHAYDASARFITAVDTMLETLIKSTGLVGR